MVSSKQIVADLLAVSVLLLLSISLLICLPLRAGGDQSQSSAVEFVANFYRWYVPFARTEHDGPAFAFAIKRDASVFSLKLLKALRTDAAAQTRASGEVAGLDSDPFLNSQDPDESYEIVSVTQVGKRQFLSLHGLTGGKRRAQPTVIAEVEQQFGRWVFVNFHSVEGSDLLTVLSRLKTARGGTGRR